MPELRTETIRTNFGPQHPSTHGVLYLIVDLDGEVVVNVEPVIGYLHRGMEKIFENRYYAQNIAIIDRADYMSAFFNEMAICLTIERMMELEVPERAEYIRVILLELNRIASHILFYGAYGMDVGAITPFLYCWREREKVMDLFELAAGYRLHPNFFRVGGVREDVTDEFLELTRKFITELPPFIKEYETLLTWNEIFNIRTRGVGKMTPEWAINLGITGPLLRATGFKWDIRRGDPYSIYDRFDFEIPVGEHGDCFDAYRIRILEMLQSCRIIEQALNTIPDGPVRLRMPMRIKPPKGEYYARIESPRGELGCYIISDGTDKPYRLKLRAPSFVNLEGLPEILKGRLIADFIAVLGIFEPVMGEVDR
jgi:NADH-quinone oxidoreductase subunit D